MPGRSASNAILLCAAVFSAALPSAAQNQIILDEEMIFDGGLFIDGDIEIVDGKIVLKNTPDQKEPEVKPDPAGPQVLELTDGSQLHGRLVSLGRAEIVWERKDATGPLVFSPEEVRRLVLGGERSLDEKKGGATLKLDNSDWLAGELTGLKDGKFLLQIAADTQIEVERDRVEWLELSPAAAPPDAYDGPVGPMGLAGWEAATGVGGAWDYVDGALVGKSAAPVSRRFSVFPGRADIEFTAGDGGTANRGFTLWIRPGTGAPRGYTKGALYLRFQSSSLNANCYTEEGIKNFSASLPAEKEDKRMTRYRLLLDRVAGRLIVHVNGTQVADWDLPEVKESAPQTSLSWQPSYVRSDMAWTLSGLRVRPWDGSDKPDPEDGEAGKDLVSTAEGKRTAGTLGEIDAETVKLDSGEVPRSQPLFLRLARKAEPEPPPSAVARVWLASRGEFDVTGIGYKDGRLRVRSSFGGDLSLSGDTVRAIEFPHRLAAKDKRAVDGGDRLVFKNGDQLRGTLLAGSHDKPIEWKPVKGGKPVEFSQANLAGVLLGARDAAQGPPEAPHGSAVVRLQNGDWLPGELLSLGAESLLMKTLLAEEMKITRASVATLYFGSEGEAPVWDGASGREEWSNGIAVPGYYGSRAANQRADAPDPWRYLDGAFTLAGTPARNTNTGPGLGRTLAALPQKVDVNFTLRSKSQAGYSVQLFFDDNKPGFMVQGGWDSAYLYDMSPRQQGGVFFNQPQQIEFGEKAGSGGDSRRFRFLADRESGRLWMFVNGEFVGALGKRSAAKGDNPKPGKGIAIFPRPMSAPVTISDIWVAPWSGALPPGIKPGPDPAEAALPEEAAPAAEKDDAEKTARAEPAPALDAVALANGDETSGIVLGATADIVRLQCEVGEIEIPLKRTTLIDFANAATSKPGGVRFRFAGKGAITVESFRVEGGQVICRSLAAGELSFPLSLVSEIVWPADPAGIFNADAGGAVEVDDFEGVMIPGLIRGRILR